MQKVVGSNPIIRFTEARAMSQQNVEIVKATLDAYARGDYAAVFEHFDEEIEYALPPDITGGGRVHRGHAETRRAAASFLASWDEYHFEVRELIDCGDRVLCEGWQRARGRNSGVEVSEAIYTVWTLREGTVVRQAMFRNRDEAREAAGLSE